MQRQKGPNAARRESRRPTPAEKVPVHVHVHVHAPYEGAVGVVGGAQGAFQPWAAWQRNPGLAGSPESCCELNAREAASGLRVESGRHFDRYMDTFGLSLSLLLSVCAVCGARMSDLRSRGWGSGGGVWCGPAAVTFSFSFFYAFSRAAPARRSVSASDARSSP